MAIGSYPRVTVQGTSPSQNPQNGQGLMLLNPSTGQYEAATSSTFSGGGGGGDATAANQNIQIVEAQTTNNNLIDPSTSNSVGLNSEQIKNYLYNSTVAESVAQLLYDTTFNRSAAQLLRIILQELQSINANLTSGAQSTQIIQGGNVANVNGSNQLEVKSN